VSSLPLVEHILAAFLLVLYPVWDYFDTRELRTGSNPRARIRYYRKTMLIEWIAAGLVWWAAGPKILSLRLAPTGISWLPVTLVRWTVATLCILFFCAVLAPQFQALRNPRVRQKVLKQTAHLAFFLPETDSEFRWYGAVAVTAGICEEVLYRGFLLRYLAIEPWHIPMLAAVLIAAFAFGSAHLYQGVSGLISAGIGGLLFAGLFLGTGTLLVPILFHAASDLILIPLLHHDSTAARGSGEDAARA
jgi:membrane protease YdiL (CAAX protease family)